MSKQKLRTMLMSIYAISAILAFLANLHNFSDISNIILLASWMLILFLIFDMVFNYATRRFAISVGKRKYFNSMLWTFIVSIILSLLEFRETSFGLTLLNSYLPYVSHFLNIYAATLYYRAVKRKI